MEQNDQLCSCTECNDLLRGLLTSDPASRIKMPAIMAHPWITADGSSALKPHPFPNKFSVNDINEDIVEHMVHVLKVQDTLPCDCHVTVLCVCVCLQMKEKETDVTAELLTDRACAISAIYHLLLARLERYQDSMHSPQYIVCHSHLFPADTWRKNQKSNYGRRQILNVNHMSASHRELMMMLAPPSLTLQEQQ